MKRWTIFACGICGILAVSSGVSADITYLGDGTAGGLVPDFPQVWAADQKIKAICEAASSADAVWYWDQHGYGGLVAHADNAKPNDTWREDGQALVYLLAEYEYGRNPGTGKVSRLSKGNLYAGLSGYVKDKAHYYSRTNANGLVVTGFSAANASYTNWAAAVTAGKTAIAGFAWKDKDGRNTGVLHSMTSAGLDSESKKLIVTHGWDDHPGNLPPYKKPPYAGGEKPYINEYPITISDDQYKKVNIPKTDGVDLFGHPAERVAMGDFFTLAPGGKTKVSPAGGPRGKVALGAAGMNRYDYEVGNTTFDPIFQFTLEVPLSIVQNITSPPGWQHVLWNSELTPDFTPHSVFGVPPGFEPENLEPSPFPPLEGILWYTQTNPVLSNSTLSGFAYDASDEFPVVEDASLAMLSNGRSILVDPNSEGLITEYLFAPAPAIPEPECIGLALGLLMLARVRRRGQSIGWADGGREWATLPANLAPLARVWPH